MSFTGQTLAQVIPDTTLSTTVVSSDNLNFVINDGDTAGTNLFHSFDEFSVPTGGSAVFNNASDIDTIFNRVTGSSVSMIDGLIQANGSADVFLLNPNGILLGADARLNIGGSFITTTAESVVFSDGLSFSTTDASAPPLLSINAPIGLQYGSEPSAITITTAELSVNTGENIGLFGGDITLSGSTLTAPNGQIQLAGLTEAGLITLDGERATVPNGLERGAIVLTTGTTLDVTGTMGGSIALTGADLTVSGSHLQAGLTAGGSEAPAPPLTDPTLTAGSIRLDATGTTALSGNSTITNDVQAEALGNGGAIALTTDTLSLTDGSRIQTVTNSSGSSGDIDVSATGAIAISGFTNDGFFRSMTFTRCGF